MKGKDNTMLKYTLTILLFLNVSSVQAKQPIPVKQWTENARLYAAQACYAEAGFYEIDCGEILWVLTTRWEKVRRFKYRDRNTREIRLWRFSDMIREYVSALSPYESHYHKLTTRQKEIRKFPWGELQTTPQHVLRFSPGALVERFNSRWASLRRLVEEWAMGHVKRYCPGATHWGAPYGKDIKRARRAQWVKIDCEKDTKNDFWTHERPKKELIAYR